MVNPLKQLGINARYAIDSKIEGAKHTVASLKRAIGLRSIPEVKKMVNDEFEYNAKGGMFEKK